MGSKEVFSTKTRPFILSLILREPGRECQKLVAFQIVSMSDDRPRFAVGAILTAACKLGVSFTQASPGRVTGLIFIVNFLGHVPMTHLAVRAMVRTKTASAPASIKALAQAAAVAPVVNTSSTSSTCSQEISRG